MRLTYGRRSSKHLDGLNGRDSHRDTGADEVSNRGNLEGTPLSRLTPQGMRSSTGRPGRHRWTTDSADLCTRSSARRFAVPA